MWATVLSHRGCDVEPVLCFIMRHDTAGMCAQPLSNADDIGRSFFLQACLHEEQTLFKYKAILPITNMLVECLNTKSNQRLLSQILLHMPEFA